jgi:hypothetical protein
MRVDRTVAFLCSIGDVPGSAVTLVIEEIKYRVTIIKNKLSVSRLISPLKSSHF